MLFLFFLFMVKHFVCDFALQGRLPKEHDKWKLTSRKGHLHALDHALGTAGIFVFVSGWIYFTTNKTVFISVLIFGILDYIIHFFIDWLKNNFVKANDWPQSSREFWILTSIDQSLHALTYLIFLVLFDIYIF